MSRESLVVAGKASLAAIVAAVAVGAASGQPLLVTVPLALIAYAVTALALRVIGPEDLRALAALVGFGYPSSAPRDAGAHPVADKVA